MGMFTRSTVGRRAGLVLLGIAALLVARGWHRTRAVSTEGTAAGHQSRRAHVAPGGPALSSIAGTIRDDDTTPLLHVRVCARLANGATRCATADDHGAYAIDDLVAGTYQIAALADRHLPMRSDALVLGLGEHRDGVDLVLPAGGVEITGTVSDLRGGPIARAEVYASPTTSFASVETDDDGRFHMWVWPGRIGVHAVADGYATAHAWNRAPATFDLVMSPAGTLGGVVLDARTRTPVVGAHVSLTDRDEVTDADGRFQFEGLSPDRYIAIAVARHAYGRSEGSVRVGLGQHVDDVVVLLQPAAGVEGKVLVGAPPKPCAEPSLSLLAGDDRVALDSRAGPDGSVRIDGVRPGTYRLWVSCEGYTPIMSPPVEVADGDVTGLVWTLGPIAEGTIRGRVLSSAGAPIRGAQVSAGGREAISHPDGSFVLEHLEIGNVTVEVRSERGVGPADGWGFDVDAGATVTSDLVLTAGGVISGTVTNPDGSPAANVAVRTEVGHEAAQRTSDASGRFQFVGLPEGRFELVADADGDNASRRQDVSVRPGQTSTATLVVAPRTRRITGIVVDADGKPRTDVYVAASRDIFGDVDNGVLTGADGTFGLGPFAAGTYVVRGYESAGAEAIVENVRPGTAVRLQLRPTGSIAGTVHTQVDDFELEIDNTHVPTTLRKEAFYRTAGRYHVDDLPPGSYRITVSAGGREVQTIAELAPGAHLDHVDIAFDDRTRLVGRVIDVASKQPVAGLGVSVELRGGHRSQRTRTDRDGRFELADAPRGEVVIDLDHDEYVGVRVRRQLAGNEVELGDIYTVERHRDEPRGSIGVTTQDLRIVEIDPAGPAANTELAVGDVITSIDGVDAGVLASETVCALFEPPPGTVLQLAVARGATVTVVAAPR
jgi:hypothetical protein